MAVTSVTHSPPLKRKREAAEDDLEIDLSLPEPLSKKEARRAKKRKDKSANADDGEGAPNGSDVHTEAATTAKTGEDKASKRSEYGIWIGNLPFAVTKLDIRNFLCKDTEIKEEDITRVHMPTSSTKGAERGEAAAAAQKPKNKGFAYVDFTTADVLAKALELSEQLVLGRRVLIKNAQSFEGRPAVDPAAAPDKTGKPPSKRVFVGNLAFSVDEAQLRRHFAQCGAVEDVHVATFEDSGKCKGYAWITFEEVEAAVAAVRGFVLTGGGGETGAKSKRRAVDRIEGRVLRREFAEDKSVRYNKRFGKGAKRIDGDGDGADAPEKAGEEAVVDGADASVGQRPQHSSSTAHGRRREKRQAAAGRTTHEAAAASTRGKQKYVPHDTRPRPSKATGSIPAGVASGTKVSFD